MRIKRFKLKEGTTLDEIRSYPGIKDNYGTWISKDTILHLTIKLSVVVIIAGTRHPRKNREHRFELDLGIGFPEDLSHWDDYTHTVVLDMQFCQPYYPFYHRFNTEIKDHEHVLKMVVEKYNATMASLPFLEEIQ